MAAQRGWRPALCRRVVGDYMDGGNDPFLLIQIFSSGWHDSEVHFTSVKPCLVLSRIMGLYVIEGII